jgi:ABC-type multidrug transport system fused ATPase/permease subunit
MARWDAGAASAALIFASIIAGVVGQTHQTRISLSAAMLARDVVCGAVYQKAMRLKPNTVPSGTVTNLMAVDSNVVVMTIEFGQYIWFGPATTVIGIGLQYSVIGASCLAGFGAILLLMLANSLLAILQGRWASRKLTHSDARITKISEIIAGIRVVKAMAWEPEFLRRIDKIRRSELSFVGRTLYNVACIRIVAFMIPFFASAVTFVVSIGLGRIVVLYFCSFTSYQIHDYVRCLYI